VTPPRLCVPVGEDMAEFDERGHLITGPEELMRARRLREQREHEAVLRALGIVQQRRREGAAP
jgi:hypothetical protein